MTNTVPKINIHKIEFLTENKEVIQEVENFIEEWNNSKEEIISKTSGSTGIPKEIKVKKQFMIESAKMTGDYFNFNENETIVLSLSAKTIGGKMQIIRALIHKMNLIVTDNARNPLKNFNQRARFISLVPLQLEEIIKENKEKLLLFDTILIGGAAINPSLEADIKEIKTNFFESYGMTETLSHVALRKISASNPKNFHALKGIEFSQEDACLKINAPKIGIQNLITNDVVELISSTEFVLKGRKDFVINSGGYKFHPEILEEKLTLKINFPFFILGEKNIEFGEIVTFFIEKTYSLEMEKELAEIFKTTLEKYEIPKKIYFVLNFEKTESGKINRLKTQEIHLNTKI